MTSQSLNECDRFHGRLRTICRGESDLCLEKTNNYRERFGLAPLEELSGDVVKAKQTKRRDPAGGSSCCGKRNTSPRKKLTLVERAKKYAQSIAKHIADDSASVCVSDLQFRQSRCGSCPFNRESKCDLCGCPLKKNMLNNGKLMWRSESCPVGMWSRQSEARKPLVDPVHHLIFHLYPKIGAEWNWHWHIEKIREHANIFNGKICIGVGIDKSTAGESEVRKLLSGIPVSDLFFVGNTKLKAETETHVELLRRVKTDDPNHIVFRYHTKGVTHLKSAVEQDWAELMWEVNTDLPSVHDALASHLTCGAMRSQTPLADRPGSGGFFYAGSAYWMRCKEVFERAWDFVENERWWVEYVPEHLFKFSESACLLHDFTEHLAVNRTYFESVVRPEWEQWKIARGI